MFPAANTEIQQVCGSGGSEIAGEISENVVF